MDLGGFRGSDVGGVLRPVAALRLGLLPPTGQWYIPMLQIWSLGCVCGWRPGILMDLGGFTAI